eukprot:766490-Hanusia_phi.AAC.6
MQLNSLMENGSVSSITLLLLSTTQKTERASCQTGIIDLTIDSSLHGQESLPCPHLIPLFGAWLVPLDVISLPVPPRLDGVVIDSENVRREEDSLEHSARNVVNAGNEDVPVHGPEDVLSDPTHSSDTRPR